MAPVSRAPGGKGRAPGTTTDGAEAAAVREATEAADRQRDAAERQQDVAERGASDRPARRTRPQPEDQSTGGEQPAADPEPRALVERQQQGAQHAGVEEVGRQQDEVEPCAEQGGGGGERQQREHASRHRPARSTGDEQGAAEHPCEGCGTPGETVEVVVRQHPRTG